ncbi:MAG: methyltransferase domain-containing protein [Pseudomonadota bacterium]
MILSPRRPTFSRLKTISTFKTSILRTLENEIIPNITLKGKTLDLGGGSRAGYNKILRPEGQLDTINISPEYHPTFLADANTTWPVASESYDNLISFNTLEHLWNDTFALSEGLRVLKPGGSFHIIVPFLYRVHASPFDFHRHTHEAWEMMLAQLGVPATHQRIEPIVWDSMATAFSFLELTRLRFLKPAALLIGVLRCIGMKGDRLPDHVAVHWREWALGYYISGTKPVA